MASINLVQAAGLTPALAGSPLTHSAASSPPSQAAES
jgi:hypothetical protein